MAGSIRLALTRARTPAGLVASALIAMACGKAPTAPRVPLVPHLSVTRILAFGDSLTEGEATPAGFDPFFIHPTNDPGTPKGYPYKLLTLLSQRYPSQTILVYNGGYGGRFIADDATDKPDRTLGEFLDAFKPEVLILMHGANDLNQENPVPDVRTIASYAGLLIDKAQARGTEVFVSSLPPRLTGGTPNRAKNPQLVVPYNAALQALAAQKGVPFVNVYPAIVPSLAGPDIAPDGLHLTQAGNDKLAAVYLGALQLFYETIR